MTTRRRVLKTLSAASAAVAFGGHAASARSYGAILGANDKVRVAVIGVRSRGRALAYAFRDAGADVTTIVDVDEAILADTAAKFDEDGFPQPAHQMRDMRRAFDDPEIDVVAIATPDHWHTPAALMALDAGKPVYVEKPCGHNPAEGEMLVAAMERYGLPIQMGNQQRSAKESIELIGRIRDGELGDVYHANTWYGNKRGSIGTGQEMDPPETLDWELWQGPAPRQAYRDNIHPYNWHWMWTYGTAEACNNAAHELDIARWALGAANPERVVVDARQLFRTDDDWEMYDTMNVKFEYPGGQSIAWDGHSCNRIRRYGRTRGTQILGTKGSAIVDRNGYEMYGTDGKLVEERKIEASSSDSADLVGLDQLTVLHAANFLAVVQGKESALHSPIDEGATSTLMCHLANIGARTEGIVDVDPETGKARGRKAMRHWDREYADGWAPKI